MKSLIQNLEDAYRSDNPFETLIKKPISQYSLQNMIPNAQLIHFGQGEDTNELKKEIEAHLETYKQTSNEALSHRYGYFGVTFCHFFGKQGIFTLGLPNVWININPQNEIEFMSQREMKRETLKVLLKKMNGTLLSKVSINFHTKQCMAASQGTFVELDRDCLNVANNPFDQFCVVLSCEGRFVGVFRGVKRLHSISH
jgi:hypothetical protein